LLPSSVAKSRIEEFLLGERVRGNPTVIKGVTKIVDSFRQTQILEKEIRTKNQELLRMQLNLDEKRATLSNNILTVSIMVVNLSNENAMEDLDRIFVEDEAQAGHQRQTLSQVSRYLRMIYATDAVINPSADFIQEVNQRAADILIN
jgi:hypothetical protein